ncbi:hypothetical protein KY290_027395 [Solanum tuberosum]|uniref:Retrotransposon gag domain-containing protein n=1 Tax=Solanum tuberosum TaxID=4113 RepID=A0ABQ7UGQ5_SOLTU|nr:hypothetical protein KY290_027395 [Solanum tuberosum]
MPNTRKLEAQRQRLRQDTEALARGAHNNANDPNIVHVEDEVEEEFTPPQQQLLAPRGRGQQPRRVAFEEDHLELDGAGDIGAIVLPILPPGLKFTTTSTMIQLLNLKGEATNWLNELPRESIRTWAELREAFMERVFPEVKEFQMKDEISSHKQVSGEAMHDT